jgi:transposase-like protein
MSKIPQGEWSAIAARHAQGESLSAIARSYGCTPPAIHYVLKRNGRQPAEKVEQLAEAAASRPNEPDREAPPQTLRSNGEITLSLNRANESAGGGSPEPATLPIGLTRTEQRPAPIEPRPAPIEQRSAPIEQRSAPIEQRSAPIEQRSAPIEQRSAPIEQPRVTELQQHRAPPPTAGRTLAVTDGLDSELHDRAEAAIETFRSCFDAALAEGSPHDRARLRQAASDLMRVAARTTIVLDRLNALSERATVWSDSRSISNRRA